MSVTSKSCLFIDNDSFNQAIFLEALSDVSPHTICLTASDGTDAMHILKKENIIPSYIIIELDLPKMGGLEFLKIIKQDPHLRDIPVIVHSTSPQPHLIIQLKELGATAIYYRPYDYYGVTNMLTLYFNGEMARIQPN
jgi:CheY-like chemotaxis protein